MNKIILTLFQDFVKITGNTQVAALLVHSQVLASFDETILSVYEDIKKTMPQMTIKNLLESLIR